MSKEGIRGTAENPVDNSFRGQKKLTAELSRTAQQPGAVQRPAMGQTAEEGRNGRQEPDADGSSSLSDSEETAEAIRTSPRAESRRGRTAVGKSGQGAMKNDSDPVTKKKYDSYMDISPAKKELVGKNVTEIRQKAAADANEKTGATGMDENFSHFDSNNGNF